jgi:hypothetical protein
MVGWEKRPELDTSRTTTDDNHVEKAVNLFGTLTRETSGLDAYQRIREFSTLQRAKWFPRTVEETVLHLRGLSTRKVSKMPNGNFSPSPHLATPS